MLVPQQAAPRTCRRAIVDADAGCKCLAQEMASMHEANGCATCYSSDSGKGVGMCWDETRRQQSQTTSGSSASATNGRLEV